MSAVTLGSNLASIKAQRQLGKISAETGNVFERLSSGQRINRASDDAAGLSVVSSLTLGQRVFTRGVQNLNDGISLLNIADGAIEQLTSITIRLKELAEQAANGTYGSTQRKAMDTEGQQLSREYFRIVRSTSFNGQGLFFREFGQLRLQSGFGANGGIQSGLGGAIGTGSLATPVTYVGEATFSTSNAFGDVNRDGMLDLVSAGYDPSDGYSTIRLGNSDGTFGAATSYLQDGLRSLAVQLGDLNGDGNIDLITAGHNDSNQATVTIRMGNGNGSFGAALSFRGTNSLTAYESIALSDLNGDGNLDLAAVGTDNSTISGVDVYLGGGNGTFGGLLQFSSETAASYGFSKILIADINGDSISDIATSKRSPGGGAYVSTRMGRGDGTFGTITSYTVAGLDGFGGLAGGDFNGDGSFDLAAASTHAGGGAVIFLNNGNGTFNAGTSYLSDTYYSSAIASADLNGDGNLDLVTGGRASGTDDATTSVLLGRGNGTFESAATYIAFGTGEITGISVGDLNGDGCVDLCSSGRIFGGTGKTAAFLSNTVDGISPLLSFKLTSRADALQALSQFDKNLQRLTLQRGTIGAFQSRIDVASSVLRASSDNYAAAAGRIRDADFASESARLVSTGILQQAASAVLAQANQQPGLALQLL